MEIKLEHPLKDLFNSCEKLCEVNCCGINAFDFSPIHIASFLIKYSARLDKQRLATTLEQLVELKRLANSAPNAERMTIIDANQHFTTDEFQNLIVEIQEGLERAVKVIELVETRLN